MTAGIVARSPLRDNSFLWHVRAGSLQIDRGSVLTSDPFSFFAPQVVWRTQSWLADIGYGWLETFSSLGFVWPMIWLVGSLLLGSAALAVRARTKSVVALAVYLNALALALAPFLNPRPALFSMLLMAILVLVTDRSSLWWSLPLLSWVWAASHGSWPIGLAFVALTAVIKRDWRLGFQVLPMSVVTLLTAHGWGNWEILLDFARARDDLALITEWAPTSLIGLPGGLFLLALLLMVVSAANGRLSPRSLLLVAPFAFLGVSSTRSLPFALLALTPTFVEVLRGREDGRMFSGASSGQAVFNSVIGVALLAAPLVVAKTPQLDPTHFPVAAAMHLEPGNVFHDDTTGGFLIYAQGPARQVFVDDRAELYGDRIREFISARNSDPTWRSLFLENGIEQVLLRRSDPLGQLLRARDWRQVFIDDVFILLASPS